jgi:hypothetical protein
MDGQKVFPFRSNLTGREGNGRMAHRMGWLTPYELETLCADALWAGGGAQLDVTVPARTSDLGLAWVRDRFDGLRKRGIAVRVRRDEAWVFQVPARAGARGR